MYIQIYTAYIILYTDQLAGMAAQFLTLPVLVCDWKQTETHGEGQGSKKREGHVGVKGQRSNVSTHCCPLVVCWFPPHLPGGPAAAGGWGGGERGREWGGRWGGRGRRWREEREGRREEEEVFPT